MMKGLTVDHHEQRGLITEVHSDDGSPPYVVHWLDSDHLATVFPGPDAIVVTAAEQKTADERATRRIAVGSVRNHTSLQEQIMVTDPDVSSLRWMVLRRRMLPLAGPHARRRSAIPLSPSCMPAAPVAGAWFATPVPSGVLAWQDAVGRQTVDDARQIAEECTEMSRSLRNCFLRYGSGACRDVQRRPNGCRGVSRPALSRAPCWVR